MVLKLVGVCICLFEWWVCGVWVDWVAVCFIGFDCLWFCVRLLIVFACFGYGCVVLDWRFVVGLGVRFCLIGVAWLLIALDCWRVLICFLGWRCLVCL